MLNVNDVNQLYLGVQGENLQQTIVIDVSPWLIRHPQGSVSIWHKRNGDSVPSATGAVFDDEAGTISWSPTNTDTYVAGEGEAEIRLTEGTIIKKTRSIRTGVSPAVTGGGQTLGSDWQSYIDEVDRIKGLAVAAKQAAETAQSAAETAEENAEAWAVGQRGGEDVDSSDPTYHHNAYYYANLAGTSEEQARGYAETAVAAKNTAVSAKISAEAAAGSAALAQEKAEQAQGKAELAQGKAEEAQGKAETAQGKAETAKTAAEAAASTATTKAAQATASANRAEEALAREGYLHFEIIEGDLIMTRTPNTQVNFYLSDGDLYITDREGVA